MDLNPEQKKEFKKLVIAYKKCEKLGVLFVNNYGQMEAYNKQWIESYTDRQYIQSRFKNRFLISTHDEEALNTFKTDPGWADDEHILVTTDLGEKIYKEQNERN